MTLTRTLAAALLAGGALAAPASAATLGLTVDPSVSIAGTAQADNDPFFFGFTATTTGGLSGSGFGGDPAPLDLVLSDFAVGPLPLGAEFTISGADTVLTSATLLDLAVESDAADDGDDVIELLFGSLGGSAGGDFGAQALLVLTGEFGADPIGTGFATTDIAFAANPVALAPIPLPAGMTLLLGGIAALGAARALRRGA
jgi:hypothetical protein